MNFDKKNKINTPRDSAFSKIEKVHPFMMMLYLSIGGIAILFLILVVAYLQTRSLDANAVQYKFPKYFNISTLLLLVSSFTLRKTLPAYKKENLPKLKRFFLYTILLTFCFVFSQLGGWNEISRSGVSFAGMATGTYIYLLSALHAVHILAGLGFLSFLYFKAQHMAADPIRTLIYIRNPFVLQQIKMLNLFWHFMGGLWLFLYLVFLFTMNG
ncbi:cytochrome c oxidase subunit 3 [Adhaeribacter aquaticus]|uniref:cytochrome c oxidase subunit 3 n=1 Tax=Adhaeribacter aquaticus TaxID=299567 RepID=UPI0003F6B74A|nr:cytochrome c oxidase subunit III [Adhaeribacter aquaticus]